MQHITYQRASLIGALLVLTTLGCEERHKCGKKVCDQEESASLTQELIGEPIVEVSKLQAERGQSALLDDEPAQIGYQSLEEAFGQGRQGRLGINVYALEAVPDADATVAMRSAQLGLVVEPTSAQSRYAVATLGDKELRIHRLSGAERFFDRQLFHKGDGSSPLESRERYVDVARQYILTQLPHLSSYRLYPYKYREYVNVDGKEGEASQSTVYQSAVAFNMTVDDVPVIGPGDKLALHMTPQGYTVSYEHSLRAPAGLIAQLSGDELVGPADAEKLAWSNLSARGVNAAHYTVSRAEFGYLRLGRSSVQRYLIPHYAFFFESNDPASSKKQVEVIPATSRADILAMAQEDQELESGRKQELYGPAEAPDERPR